MKKVSLNTKDFPELKGGFTFRSSDGKYRTREGLPVHWVKPNEPVLTNDIPNSLLNEGRVIIEDAGELKEKEKIRRGLI